MLRKTLFDVIYQNVNITAHMSPDVLSMSYTDNEDGQVDDCLLYTSPSPRDEYLSISYAVFCLKKKKKKKKKKTEK